MKTYKTEIRLTNEQKTIYAKTVGVCRYVCNLFISTNKTRYENGEPYMNNYDFSKWLNNEYLPNNPDKSWIKEVSSKAVRNAIDNSNKAYIRFFKKQGKFPRFKKKGKNDCSYYFVRTSKTQPIKIERHKIAVPCMGYVSLKEYGYIPVKSNITSGIVTKRADRYYISVTTDERDCKQSRTIVQNNINDGIGIDLGLKDFAIISTGKIYKTKKQNKLKKKLKREQRRLSRKYKFQRNYENKQNLKKGKCTDRRSVSRGIEIQKTVVAKIHQKIANVREDYQNKIVNEIVKSKPSYITIEDLNVRGMMKNRHLSEAIANQGFNSFISKLTTKAIVNGIDIRKVDRFYPSSKLCHKCGCIKSDLTLSDRIYKCQCGYVEDRDLNAAMNLRDAKTYKMA